MSRPGKKAGAPTHAGTVVASFGRQFTVELADGTLIPCVTRGKRTDLACGDRVSVAMTAPDQGVIESIAPRASLFYRSDVQREKLIAANVTQIVIVLAVAPPFHGELLDRCLAAAEEARIPALLALNKMDLAGAPDALQALDLYRSRPSLGFTDCVLIETVRKAGHLPLGTFDRGLGKVDGTIRL